MGKVVWVIQTGQTVQMSWSDRTVQVHGKGGPNEPLWNLFLPYYIKTKETYFLINSILLE